MKKTLALTLALSLALGSFSFAYAEPRKVESFTDLKDGHWAKPYIASLTEIEAIKGYPDKTFRPNGTITAAEFVKIVVALEENDVDILKSNLEMENSEAFDEVEADNHWAAIYMKMAELEGYLPGDMFTKDAWNKPITREKMAVIMENASQKRYDVMYTYDGKEVTYDQYLEYLVGEDESIKAKLETKENPNSVASDRVEKAKKYLKDYSSICSLCQEKIARAVAKGIISGYPDATFKPQNTATRAEAASMIVRLIAKDLRKEIDLTPKEEQKTILDKNVVKEGNTDELITDDEAKSWLHIENPYGRDTNMYKLFKDGSPFQMKYLGMSQTLDYKPKHLLEMKIGSGWVYLLDENFKYIGRNVSATENIGELRPHIFIPEKYGDPKKAAYFAWREGSLPNIANSNLIYIVPNTYIK